jgi:hypothetical protein
VSGAPWIVVSEGASGQGNDDVKLAISANLSPTPRTGTATIAGLTFTVQQEGMAAREIEVNGSVSGLTGVCPSITFAVSGRLVVAIPSTEFARTSCTNLRNGVRVEVRGTLRVDGVLVASRVRTDNDDDN